MNATATTATVKDPLPISPLSNVVSGPRPLRNRLHVGLLVVVWFLPGTALLALLSTFAGFSPAALLAWGAWLVVYATLAGILSALVGRGASVPWTLAIHAL